MPITSAIIHIARDKKEKTFSSINEMRSVDILHQENDLIVVLLETKTWEEDKKLIQHLQQLSGIVSIQVAFSSIEDCVT